MNDEIDMEGLKTEGKEFTSRPMVFCKQPDKKNNFYGYRVKFIEEPRSFTSEAGNNYECADGLLVEVINDPDVESGKEYTWILPYVLKKKLLQLGANAINGKTFDFAGRGLRKPKKKGSKPYYDFGVMLKEGTLAWSMLTRALPIRGRTPMEKAEQQVENAGEFISAIDAQIQDDLETLGEAKLQTEAHIAECTETLSAIDTKAARLQKVREILSGSGTT